jgi:hypothetical protein
MNRRLTSTTRPEIGLMNTLKSLAIITGVGFLTTPAFADDCSPISAAMIATAKTPHTATLTRVKDGKPVTGKIIQTKDDKFVEVDGKWHSMGDPPGDTSSIEAALKKAKITCRKLGTEQVEGQTTTVYTAHVENEGTVSDDKLWLGSNGLPVKVENLVEGRSYSTTFDYAHADAPADATPMRPK